MPLDEAQVVAVALVAVHKDDGVDLGLQEREGGGGKNFGLSGERTLGYLKNPAGAPLCGLMPGVHRYSIHTCIKHTPCPPCSL